MPTSRLMADVNWKICVEQIRFKCEFLYRPCQHILSQSESPIHENLDDIDNHKSLLYIDWVFDMMTSWPVFEYRFSKVIGLG